MTHRWKKTLISPSSSIRSSLEVINNEALRAAIVVDDEGVLLGVVADGDIRRGFLNDLDLNDSVSTVMSSNPITASLDMSKADYAELMTSEQILFLPITDSAGKVVAIETLQDVLGKPKYENPVFIMAGGFGTRLRPLTENCPKPMLKVGDRPILETVIRSFIKAGFVNFYISTHYMPEQIHSYFGDGSNLNVNITYVHESEPLGTGGALGLLPKNLHNDLPLVMMNGDVLTSTDYSRLLEFHTKNNASATMCVREYEYQVPYGVIQGEGLKITSMVEKPIQRFFINAGIYVVSPKIVSSVPENYRIDMPTLLEKSIGLGENVLKFPIHEYWLDIGRMDDFNRAQIDIHSLDMV